MNDQLVTTQKIMDYLGTDEENREIVESLLVGAIAALCSMVGRDITKDSELGEVNEALRAMVYMGYFVRGEKPGNLEFLQRHLSSLVTRLQLTKLPQGNSDAV